MAIVFLSRDNSILVIMKAPLLFLLLIVFVSGFKKEIKKPISQNVIAKGHIPNVATDNRQNLHLVYGKGDSILYSVSSNGGSTFSTSLLVDVLPKLYSFAMRGPQIFVTGNKITIIAADQKGNIYSYLKQGAGKWIKSAKVNDRDTIAKEGLLALSGDGVNYLFAVWLDTRKGGHNNIYGAKSIDGGKTWSENKMIYTSPDGHVCECCKPSLSVKGNKVAVMFRNWFMGNRDLYLVESKDSGENFGKALKLGYGSWALNGCPMDGGGVAYDSAGIAHTVWQRKGAIYACTPGKEETEKGRGRNCTIATMAVGNIYAWVEEGKVVCLIPGGAKQVLGAGSLPILKVVQHNKVVCIWQQEEDIVRTILSL